MPLTITEALAEIKTIDKRLVKKRDFVMQYLSRHEGIKDPLASDGGSVEGIKRERQAIADLETRIVELRRAIQRANEATTVTINGTARTIADWLIWRRDISENAQAFLSTMRSKLNQTREQAKRSGVAVVQATATTGQEKPTDFIISINETELAAEIEGMEDTLGQLDGQLSLKNATVILEGV